MAEITETAGTPGTDTASKRRFQERVKRHARKAIYKSLEKTNITDIGKGGVDVVVDPDDLSEPTFHHGQGGFNRRVMPGNKEFRGGERQPRPQGGGGGGAGKGQASDSGEGEDAFTFHMTQKEVIDFLMQDLGLPNMRKLSMELSRETKLKFSGFTKNGPENRLDRKRTFRRRRGRLMAATGVHNGQLLQNLTEMHNILAGYDTSPPAPEEPDDDYVPIAVECERLQPRVERLRDAFYHLATPDEQQRFTTLEAENEGLAHKLGLVPSFVKSTDMQVRNFTPQPVPCNKAVMCCLMDVSGSMDEEKKTFAKILFFLMHTFLTSKYDNIELVFIRYHSNAKEVDEQEFFYGKDTGGTVTSLAYRKMNEIVDERYRGKNVDIYMGHASDGDNFLNDMPACREEMDKILGYTRGAFYAEITQGAHQHLWDMYEEYAGQHPDFVRMGQIEEQADIVRVFRDLFKVRNERSRAPTRAAALEMA